MGNIREIIESEFEDLNEFADKKYDHALIGIVEEFGHEMSPLYDEAKLSEEELKDFTHYILNRMDIKGVNEYTDGELLVATGHNDDILGVIERSEYAPSVLYDKEKVLFSMVEDERKYNEDSGEEPDEDNDPMTNAIEHYDFNFMGGYLGPNTWKCALLYEGEE